MNRILSYIEYGLVAFSLATMAVITFANVLSRYVFDISFAFSEEITLNLFVLMTFVGASIAVKRNGHFSFSFLYDLMKGQLKRITTVVIGFLMILFLALAFYFGLELALSQMERGRQTPALGIPQWVFTLAVPLGSLMCIIRTLEVTLTKLKNLKNNEGGK